ncbi:MAG: hypothetical protein JEY79_12795 [Pseudodesulfovibrio sp.]|nr:hypothetical protein [Pseudodesulfovibrio sp.]
MSNTKPKNSTTGWVKDRSYPLTVEADRVLTEMKTKFKINKQDLISEAVVQFAKEKGIKVKGVKGPSLKGLSAKQKKQERTIAALCRLVLKQQCTNKSDVKDALDTIADAIDSGTKGNVAAIRRDHKEELPRRLQGKDAVTALLAALPK